MVIIALSVVMGILADRHDGPRQSFFFLNTSDELRSVTFEGILENDSLDDTWYVNEELEAGKTVIKNVNPGKYLIKVWNSEEKLAGETRAEFSLPDPEKSNHHLMYF